MADITICTASDCTQCKSCGRYKWNVRANPLYQSYSDFSMICREDNQYVMKLEKFKRSGDSIDCINR